MVALPWDSGSQLGLSLRVLAPGQIGSRYHAEDTDELFLVLRGTPLLIVEDEERELREGDLVHTPPGTPHVLIGAGEGPCTIVMVGSRAIDQNVRFLVSEAAARHGASVSEPTSDPAVAYADIPADEHEPLGRLPW